MRKIGHRRSIPADRPQAVWVRKKGKDEVMDQIVMLAVVCGTDTNANV